MKKALTGFAFFFSIALSSSGFENVSAEEFSKLMKEKNILILDVRTPEEYQKDGHIKGANLIPVQLFRYIFLGGKGVKDKKVLVYCRSGNRSAVASKMLEQWGVEKVYNLKGGIKEWKSKNFPVEYGFESSKK